MQKKIKLRLVDVLFILFCLAGAAFSLYKFFEELYRTLEKQNEEPIGIILVKENIAQRKFAEGTVWDRLRTQADVYEGDTIHTTAKSLAAVQIEDESSIELGENTLIRIHLKKKDGEGSVIDMESGAITVNSFGGSISIKSGNKVITIAPDSTLTAKDTGDRDFSLFLKSGNATVQTENGNSDSSIKLEEGHVLTLDENGNTLASVPQELLDEIDSLYSEAPVLIAPAVSYRTSYRTKLPTIRFIWSQLNLANSYLLEIADNPQLKNPVVSQRVLQTSRIINELKEGTWYWRVTPHYQLRNKGYGTPSEVQSFKISKNNVLEKPVLLSPAQNGIVSTKIPVDGGGTIFKKIVLSWKENPEAVRYEVNMWAEDSSAVTKIADSTMKNFYEINTEKVDIANGRWFWSVSLFDSEGNKTDSETRSFIAIDDKVEQRTIYPPDGFRLSEGRTANIRYSWKNNLPADTVFELARDPGFKQIIVSTTTNTNSMEGRSLPQGTYYWRIKADLADIELKTSPKTLIVEPPMQAPVITKPVNGSVAVVRPDKPYDIKWSAVEGADYYQIKIFNPSNPDKILFQKNFIESTTYKMNFVNWAERTYGISLQAFRDETPLASRATSYLGNYNFRIVQIKPIELLGPNDDIVIDGADAVKTPGTFEWNYVGTPYKSAIVIYKGEPVPENEFLRIENPARNQKMPVLYEGSYTWTVDGTTEDDYDISAGKYRSFRVTAIEKMPASDLVEPKNRRSFDKEFFRTNKTIHFEWKSVSKADRYVFRLYSPDKKLIEEQILPKNTTRWDLTDFSKLEVGTFTWSVEAQSMWGDVVFQNGIESKQTFRVSLPELKTPKTTDDGVRYGR